MLRCNHRCTHGECSCYLPISALHFEGTDSALPRAAAALKGSCWSHSSGGHLGAFPLLSCSLLCPSQPSCTPLLPLTQGAAELISAYAATPSLCLSWICLGFLLSSPPGMLCTFLGALGSLGLGLWGSLGSTWAFLGSLGLS